MWLDGLIALPLLCLAGEWALAGRRRVLGPVVVAVVWIANFYTAYMATLGAALVLLARLLLMDATVRRRLAALGRAAVTAGLGVGLAAPLVAVVWFGSEHASPGRDLAFHAAPWTDVFARLLPGTYSFLTPAVYLDSAVLLLALTLPLHAAVPRATRAVWTALPLAVLLSLQWGPTHLVWHAFATPNGSPFRQVFVLSGLMVIAAWLSLAHGVPGRRPLLAAGAVLGLVWLGASSSELIEPWAYPLALARAPPPRWPPCSCCAAASGPAAPGSRSPPRSCWWAPRSGSPRPPPPSPPPPGWRTRTTTRRGASARAPSAG
jgi:uncharacterized membrane protein YfhO